MPHVEYVIPLGENARKRHVHETLRSAVVSFMVQLEVYFEGTWRPVVRYDSAHGFSHMDWYRSSGESRKESLSISFSEALAIADEDILENWETYRDRFREGKWP